MSWTKLAVTGLVLAGLAVVCLTYDIWAAAFLGVLFAVSLNGPAERLRQHVKMPAWLSTSVVLLAVLGGLVGLGWMIGAPLAGQVEDMTEKLPGAAKSVLTSLDQNPWGRRVLQRVEEWSGMPPEQMVEEAGVSLKPDTAEGTEVKSRENDEQKDDGKSSNEDGSKSDGGESKLPSFGKMLQTLAGFVSKTAAAGTLLMVSFAVMLFVALDPDLYHRGLMWLVPKPHEGLAGETLQRLGSVLRWWMVGRLASMTAVGVLTTLGMWMIGVPAPMALGALAGLFSFVPNIGPIVASAPGLLLGLGQGPMMGLAALGVYVAAQLIESNAITPLIDQYAVSTPPGVLIVVQVVLAALAGVWGMIVATPLLVVALVLVQELYVREVLKKPIQVTGST